MRKSWKALLASPPANAHIVEVYQDPEFLAETVGLFAAEGLAQGDGVILVATPAHRRLLIAALAERGVSPKEGRLLSLDATECLALFRDGAGFNHPAFLAVVGGLVKSAAGPAGRTVRVYGEMVNLLWQSGESEAALALEQMWNDLAKSLRFSLLCAYHVDRLDPARESGLRAVCGAHTRLISEKTRLLAPWLDQKIWLADSSGGQVLARLNSVSP